MNLMLIRIYRIKEVSNRDQHIYKSFFLFTLQTIKKKEENISVSKYYNIYYKMKCEKLLTRNKIETYPTCIFYTTFKPRKHNSFLTHSHTLLTKSCITGSLIKRSTDEDERGESAVTSLGDVRAWWR